MEELQEVYLAEFISDYENDMFVSVHQTQEGAKQACCEHGFCGEVLEWESEKVKYKKFGNKEKIISTKGMKKLPRSYYAVTKIKVFE